MAVKFSSPEAFFHLLRLLTCHNDEVKGLREITRASVKPGQQRLVQCDVIS